MKIDYNKVLIWIIAGFCGIIGFTATFYLLGLLLAPLEEWLDKKIKE